MATVLIFILLALQVGNGDPYPSVMPRAFSTAPTIEPRSNRPSFFSASERETRSIPAMYEGPSSAPSFPMIDDVASGVEPGLVLLPPHATSLKNVPSQSSNALKIDPLDHRPATIPSPLPVPRGIADPASFTEISTAQPYGWSDHSTLYESEPALFSNPYDRIQVPASMPWMNSEYGVLENGNGVFPAYESSWVRPESRELGNQESPMTAPVAPSSSELDSTPWVFFRKETPDSLRYKIRMALRRRTGCDYGLGYERVMYAPMVLDTAVTSPYMGLRMRADRGLSAPDRLEYLWAKSGKGPGPETRLDYLDSIYRTELGNANAAVISEIRMRSLNPEINSNTVGFGDMLIGGKALVFDSAHTKISTIFLTHLNTGPTNRGLGTGHVSLEPGMLLRQQITDATFLFGELKYRIPIAGSAGFAGDVLTSGFGISTIWKETDRFALIPTFEIQTTSFLFGAKTSSLGIVERVDSVTACDLYPGMRMSFNKPHLGSFEMGVAGGLTVADKDWFDSRLVLDIRWLQ